jgi:hypothetical protein
MNNTRQDMFSRYCDFGMADPLNPDDPRHFENFNPTPEQVERAEAARKEWKAEFGPDPDGGDTFGEGPDPEPDYPEPEPEKCPECAEPMQWEDGDEGHPGCWTCEECHLNTTTLGTVEHWDE